MSEFNKINFPFIKNIKAKTIADDIMPIVPDATPIEYVNTYINHWGETVNVTKSGMSMTVATESHLQYGDWGHEFLNGWYIIGEDNMPVYANDEKYNEIFDKCKPFLKVLDGLQKQFNEYRVERGRGNRIFVNDKMIKGILLYPGMRLKHLNNPFISFREAIEEISKYIQEDIDSGRIVKGRYGINSQI